MTRIERLREQLDEPLLVTAPTNVRYLTGFESSNAALVVDEERVRLFTDFRYVEAARAVESVEIVDVERSLIRGLARHVSGRVGFEADHLTYSAYSTLAEAGIELVPRTGLVERLRAVKEPDELDAIERAAAVTNAAYATLADDRFVGRTERELAWRMDSLLVELGSHGPAFATIVAAGPNAALPHAHPGDRAVGEGETVIVDAGASLDGYASDCTRTFATGPLSPELEEAYEVCLRAQLAGLEAVTAGVGGRDADAAARGVIEAVGFGTAFGHGLGHGVGMAVHEAPALRPESEDVLAPGNVVTVEPGIYLPGRGGIRIEDLAVVTDATPRVLTSFTKELARVG